MFKFLVVRMEEPDAGGGPSWHCAAEGARGQQDDWARQVILPQGGPNLPTRSGPVLWLRAPARGLNSAHHCVWANPVRRFVLQADAKSLAVWEWMRGRPSPGRCCHYVPISTERAQRYIRS